MKLQVLSAVCCALALTVPQLDAVPMAAATFPNLGGNLTLHPTNGFGTFASGVLSNLTCNNSIGNAISSIMPLNPLVPALVGNGSVPCQVAMTIHNAVSGRQFPGFPDWGQIMGGAGGANNNAQCTNNVGAIFNPTNSQTNPLGFLGNMEVNNGTGRLTAGPYNFTIDPTNQNPLSVLNLPVVIWRNALDQTASLAMEFNPVNILACGVLRLTQR